MNCRLLLALVLITASTWATAGPSDKCQLVKITEWSVRKDHYRPVVDGSINGQKIGVLLDTGAFQTAILRPAAERLGLRRVMLDGQRVYGIGGETRAEAAYVDELNIAGSVRKDWPALVVGEHGFSGDVALLLGHEFFEQLDVEFDLAQRVVRLFQPRNCERAWLGYWSSNASMVPLESRSKSCPWRSHNPIVLVLVVVLVIESGNRGRETDEKIERSQDLPGRSRKVP